MKSETEETQLIDGCFTVSKARWGTWRSFDNNGEGIITSLTEERCVEATRWYLKCKQEGFPDAAKHEGSVGGKL